jgi:hypothetical protein
LSACKTKENFDSVEKFRLVENRLKWGNSISHETAQQIKAPADEAVGQTQ